jgi:hypothetical protein
MRVAVIAAAIAASTIFMRADSALSHGLCIAGETSFFTCHTKNKRWISLCGAQPAILQYRFGTQARTEFRYPEKTADSISRFRYAHYSRFQTERVEISFSSQGVAYAVFDYTEDRVHRAGVRVTTSDGQERELVCSGRTISRLTELKGTVRCDTDNALNGGNCPPEQARL